jgi:sugar phosphate isomerase/epimerase
MDECLNMRGEEENTVLHTGLLSVTFRRLPAERVVELAAEAGLDALEWGGDVHVPPGDPQRAEAVRRMTLDAGLAVAAYGSYYRVGVGEQPAGTFEGVLETALALGAPTIRVWAGNVGSQAADAGVRARVVEESRRIAELAARAGVSISYEYHDNTLTDTAESAVRLLEEVGHPNVYTLWQPTIGAAVEDNVLALRRIRHRLANVHVFHWEGREHMPLSAGRDAWRRYLAEIAAVPGDRYVMLEFVRNGDPAQFREDAAELRSLVAAYGRPDDDAEPVRSGGAG